MKSTDLFQVRINHFGSHIVVDLMIIIIITAISIFLLYLRYSHENNKKTEYKARSNSYFIYEIIIISVLIVTHFLFSLWSLIDYGLAESLTNIEFLIFPLTYGLYLTFLMKKLDEIFDQKIVFMSSLYINNTLRLLFHFSIIPLLIASILNLIN